MAECLASAVLVAASVKVKVLAATGKVKDKAVSAVTDSVAMVSVSVATGVKDKAASVALAVAMASVTEASAVVLAMKINYRTYL